MGITSLWWFSTMCVPTPMSIVSYWRTIMLTVAPLYQEAINQYVTYYTRFIIVTINTFGPQQKAIYFCNMPCAELVFKAPCRIGMVKVLVNPRYCVGGYKDKSMSEVLRICTLETDWMDCCGCEQCRILNSNTVPLTLF